MMNEFNLKALFNEILHLRRILQNTEDSREYYHLEYLKGISSYLKRGINSKQKSQPSIKQIFNLARLTQSQHPLTDKHFIRDESFDEGEFMRQSSMVKETDKISEKEIQILLQCFNKLLRLKKCKGDQIAELLKFPSDKIDNPYVKIFKSIFLTYQNPSVKNIFTSLIEFSQNIPMLQSQPSIDWGSNPTIPVDQQRIILQLMIIINASAIKGLTNQWSDKQEIQAILKQLFSLADIKMDPIDDDDYQQLVQTLYEDGYFQDISTHLMRSIFKKDLEEEQANVIMGVLLGMALNDKFLLRRSIVKLLKGHELNRFLLDGFSALLMSDADSVSTLQLVCKQLELDQQFVKNMIEFMNGEKQNLSQIIMDFLKTHSIEQTKQCASFLNLLQGEVSMIKPLVQKQGLNANAIIPILACATGNFKIISDNYQLLAEKLGIKNQQAIKYLLQLSHGHTQCFQELSQKRSQIFRIYDSDLIKALFKVTYNGVMIINHHYTLDKLDNYERGQIDKSLRLIGRKIHEICRFNSSDESSNSSNTVDLNYLVNSIQLIVKACWRDNVAQKAIIKVLMKNTEPSSIWHFNRHTNSSKLSHLSDEGILNFLRRSFKQIYTEKNKVLKLINQRKKVMIGILKTVLLPNLKQLHFVQDLPDKAPIIKTLNEAVIDYCKFDTTSNDEKLLIIEKIQDEKHKIAYQIGCTYGLGLRMKIKQPFYYCKTCNNQMKNDNLGICLICAILCHSGHELIPGAYDKIIKMTCDCGSGHFEMCNKLNDNHPVAEHKNKVGCRVMKKNLKKIQVRAIIEMATSKEISQQVNRNINKKIEVSELEDNYSTYEFLKDLTQAFGLPSYFENYPKNIEGQNGGLEAEMISKNFYKINDDKLGILYDSATSMSYCLLHNVILLAYGSVSNSFLTLMSARKEYSISDYYEQTLYRSSKDNEYYYSSQNNVSQYQAMGCLISLAQGDSRKFEIFGEGFCQIMGEIGSKERQAVDRMSDVIRLARGVQLPNFKNQEAIVSSNYYQLFEQLFKTSAYPLMVIHKLMTLSRKHLAQVMDYYNKKDTVNDELVNIYTWCEEHVFKNFIQFDQQSIRYCKSILGIAAKNEQAFEFLSAERQISPYKEDIYKAVLLKSKDSNIKSVIQNLHPMIPQSLNIQLIKVWNGDHTALIEFLVRYIEIDKTFSKSWDEEIKFETNQNQEEQQVFSELRALLKLMTNEQSGREQKLKLIYSDLYSAFNRDQEIDRQFQWRMLSVLRAVEGLCNSNSSDVIQICNAAVIASDQSPLIPKNILTALIQFYNSTWTSEQLNLIVSELQAGQPSISHPEAESYCKHLVRALEGDLISFAKIDDELLAPLGQKESHLKSLIAGIVMGQTKFDTKRIDSDQLKIKQGFDQKAPLHMLLLMTDDINLIDKIFDINEEFIANLIDKDPKKNPQIYIKNFFNFMTPQHITSPIGPLLKQSLNLKQSEKVLVKKHKQIQFLENFSKLFPQSKQANQKDTYELELFDLLQLFYNCINLDGTALTLLFYKLRPLFDSQPALASLLELQQCILMNQKSQAIQKDQDVIALVIFIYLVSLKQTQTQPQDSAPQKLPLLDSLSIQPKEVDLIKNVSLWLQGILTSMIGPDSSQREVILTQAQKEHKFRRIMQEYFEYYKDELFNPLNLRKEQAMYAVDIILGLANLCKQDYANTQRLAVKLGAFPEPKKLIGFYQVVKQHKGLFDQLKAQLIPPAQPKPLALPPAVDLENINIFESRKIYDYFTANQATIGFEEFQTICKHMGLKLSQAKLLQCFSKADNDNSGILNSNEFATAMNELKDIFVLEHIEESGLSMHDMVISIVFTIVLLIMMFVFIFIGIEAFAPSSSFSSVVNSALPMFAGLFANRNQFTQKMNASASQVLKKPALEASNAGSAKTTGQDSTKK